MTEATPRFRGPSLILLATVHIVLFAAGLAVGTALRHSASFVTPFAPAEQLRLFFAQNPTAVRVSNFFLFGSAVPFGIFAVTTVSWLRFLQVRAAGTNIALLGGLAATMALFLSGIAGWLLSVPEVSASIPTVKAIDFLNFLCGGVFYGSWNARCIDGRTFLVEPDRLPCKLLHSDYEISRFHLDAFRRRRVDEKTQGGPTCAHPRFPIDCGATHQCE
jgi:hypothetical protein